MKIHHIIFSFILVISLLAFINCENRLLTDGWVLSIKDGVYPARIPSTVIDDLIINNVLAKDFYYRDNFLRAYQYQTQDAVYYLNFFVNQTQLNSKYKEIFFQGLDTHCQVFLNNKKILQSHNMFRRYQINVQLLRVNNLTIKFYSAANHDMIEQKKFQQKYGFNLPQNYSFSRKAAYHYGWDWGPRIVSAGIWKNVSLNCYNQTKFDNVQLKSISEITNQSQLISTQITVNISHLDVNNHYSFEIYVIRKSNNFREFQHRVQILNKSDYSQVLKWDIRSKVQSYIWWVWQLGEQPLFELRVKIINILTKQQFYKIVSNIGFRSIKLIQDQSQGGKQFTLRLNGLDIYARGGNYIPPEMSLSKTTPQTYKTVIKNARQQNFNMIRLWGGGQFENDQFYSECDKAGILIWHDLMFACALYPYSEQIGKDIQQEMRDNLIRLRQHPSIGLWNGNNQVWIGWQEWGWKNNKTEAQKQLVQDMYKEIFQNSLPKVINEITPEIPYWETSPSVSSNSPQNLKSGDIHFWRVWGAGTPIEQYNTFIGRFNSEYGMQAMPQISTIQKFTQPDDRNLGSLVLRLHQRHPKGDYYLPAYVKNNTHNSQNLTRFSYLSQVMQSYALELATTSLRGSKPFNMGSLYWQLNDVWPVSSWATVDYLQGKKAAHYKVRQIYQPLMVSCFDPEPDTIGNYLVYATNDYNKKFNCHFQLKTISFNGTILNTTYAQKVIQPMQRVQVLRMLTNDEQIQNLKDIYNSSFISINMTCLQKQSRQYNFFFSKMKNRTITSPGLTFEYFKQKNTVKVSTKKIATYVWIYSVVKDKHYSFRNIEDNYFTLLPGQTRTISLGDHQVEAQAGISVTSYQIEALEQVKINKTKFLHKQMQEQ